MPNDALRRAGNLVNQYLGDVSTAAAPGMTDDLWSFIQNELTKYPGTREADPNTPGFDVVNNVITNLLSATGLNDPLSQTGGPSQAILGPIGRVTAGAVGSAGAAKGVNQAQKKIIKALFRGDEVAKAQLLRETQAAGLPPPGKEVLDKLSTLKEVVASPRMMHVGVPGAGVGKLPQQQTQKLLDDIMQGSYAHYQPGNVGGTVRVHPNVMRGLDVKPPLPNARLSTSPLRPQPQPLVQKGVEGLPDIVTHEATHFLNDPGFTNMILQGANRPQFNLAAGIRPFIGHTKFGQAVVGQHLARGATPTAVDEALSYLAQPTGRSPAATWLHNTLTSRPQEGGIGQFDEYTQGLLQDILSAALEVPGARR